VSRPIEYFDSESCTWKPATFHAWEDAPGADESKLALVELSNGEMTHVIITFAEIPGFLSNAEQFYERADVEAAAWRAFVEEWWRRHQDEEVVASELMKIVAPETGDGIDLDLGKGSEKSQQTRLGFLPRQQRDRRYGRLRITAVAKKRKGSQQWRLVPRRLT
jgi:hypothetical protein